MSLFKFKDWWSVQCSTDEQFSHHSLCVCNIDNSIDGSDKIIVASLSGVLRIYSVGFNPTEDGLPPYQASDLLMEMDFKLPILQVSAGLLLSATTNIQLAILYPKKLSIYSVSSTAGVTEHGSAYNILLIYEHIIKRSAFYMTLGPFGHIRGKDFICVQSLDGNLVFYEQESLAFNRFLPNVLLPGAMSYFSNSDSFVLSTSLWTIDSYRYQVLAIANNDDDDSRESSQQSNGSHLKGRKLTPDWSLSLGESVIDMKVVNLDKNMSYLIVLGERNLYAIKENGNIWFMKKFDFNASCLTAYANDTNDSVISVVATHISTLIVYCNDRAMWATQLPFVPVCIQRAAFPNLTGAIVCLSDTGLICCGYLGTNPSIKIVSVPNTQFRQINYPESEKELQELRQIINLHNLEGNQIESKVIQNNLNINIIDVNTISAINSKMSNPFLKITIELQTTSNIRNVRLGVELHKSLIAEPNIIAIPSMSNTSDAIVNEVIIFKDSQVFPASTRVELVVTYNNEEGAPRIASKTIYIPINILAKIGQPSKEAEHKLSLNIVNEENKSIKLTEIFSDLFESDSNSTQSVGLEIYDDHNVVSIITSIKSKNQRFLVVSESFGALAFIANELLRRLSKNNVKYDVSHNDISFVPLNKLFVLIDEHLLARHRVIEMQNSLSTSATQFRAIQKRLLIKLKDRNPTPLNNLETLLKLSQTQINGLTEKLLKSLNELDNKSANLSSALNLIYNLLYISAENKSQSLKAIQPIFTNYISDALEEGWEERTELALITLLDSYGKEISNVKKMTEELSVPENSGHIKRLINLLLDKVLKGENFNTRDNNNQKHLVSNQTIPEEEE